MCVHVFFEALGLSEQKKRRYGCFCASEAFVGLRWQKSQYLQWFFGPVPSKNTGTYAVFIMLQEVLFPCPRHTNTVNYSVMAFGTHQKTNKIHQKVPKMAKHAWTEKGCPRKSSLLIIETRSPCWWLGSANILICLYMATKCRFHDFKCQACWDVAWQLPSEC